MYNVGGIKEYPWWYPNNTTDTLLSLSKSKLRTFPDYSQFLNQVFIESYVYYV